MRVQAGLDGAVASSTYDTRRAVSPIGAINAKNRESRLDAVDGASVDVVIIGGGITGAGVARELTRRGASVVVFDQGDFASGTSSRSSKLIHGGFRYLAQGDVATVRKVAKERAVIHRLAKHLCEPNWMVFPTEKKRTTAKMVLGVTSYEKIGDVTDADRHRVWDRDELAELEPLVDRERYGQAVVWREYITDDARLVLANLRDAVDGGAHVLNHCSVTRIDGEPAATGVTATCAVTGRTFNVGARAIVNAAGPWVDPVRALESATPPRLVLSKGIHLVVRHDRLPVNGMITVTTADKRSIFVVPRGDASYIGTTDTLVDGPAEKWPSITGTDAQYLLDAINRALDFEPLTLADVSGAWAGLRPLIDDGKKVPGEISRKDELWDGPRNVVTVAGGKLTGYRPMAIDVVDHLADVGVEFGASPAETGTLPGGDFDGEVWDEAERLAGSAGLDSTTARRLASLYGAEAGAVLQRGASPLAPGATTVVGEVSWAVEVDGAVTLEDVFVRRTRSAWYAADPGSLVEPMADLMQPLLGWSDVETAKQVAGARERLAADLSFPN